MLPRLLNLDGKTERMQYYWLVYWAERENAMRLLSTGKRASGIRNSLSVARRPIQGSPIRLQADCDSGSAGSEILFRRLQWPRDARSMPRPARIVCDGASESDQIGVAGADDRFGLVVAGDQTTAMVGNLVADLTARAAAPGSPALLVSVPLTLCLRSIH